MPDIRKGETVWLAYSSSVRFLPQTDTFHSVAAASVTKAKLIALTAAALRYLFMICLPVLPASYRADLGRSYPSQKAVPSPDCYMMNMNNRT